MQRHNVLILLATAASTRRAPIPSLLAIAAVHHHLIREGTRTRVGLVVESGEPREVHSLRAADRLRRGRGQSVPGVRDASTTEPAGLLRKRRRTRRPVKNYIKALNKGVLKVMSKMGISTLQSYRGAQIFEAIGSNSELVDKYFTWTASRIDGVGLDEIAPRARCAITPRFRAADGCSSPSSSRRQVPVAPRAASTTCSTRRRSRSSSTRCARQLSRLFKEFSRLVNEQSTAALTLRGLLEFKHAATPVPLEEVEPASDIVKRFATGAMSFGSISEGSARDAGDRDEPHRRQEQHRRGRRGPGALHARRQRRLRAQRDQAGGLGRFGVTSDYLVNADELQIKMAQGAKPGEGGQLPGHKVDERSRACATRRRASG